MDSVRKSVLMLHAAVMLFGLSAVLGRWISVPAVCVAGGRVVCSTLVLLILCRWKKISTRLNSFRDGCFAVIAGVVLAVHWTTFFMAVQTASVAVGTITFSTFPLFVTFLEPVIFRERLQARGVLCACVLIAGVLITVPEFTVENETTLGILWGLVSSFSYAILALFNRDLSAKYPAQTVCLYEQGTAAVVLLPFLVLTLLECAGSGWNCAAGRGVYRFGSWSVCGGPETGESPDGGDYFRYGDSVRHFVCHASAGGNAHAPGVDRRRGDSGSGYFCVNRKKLRTHWKNQASSAIQLLVYINGFDAV